MNSFRSSRIAYAQKSSGFALVIALSLMAFALILLMAVSALVQVEMTVAASSSVEVEARQNAILAANLALGDLVNTTGPDQRVSARADIVADDAPYWTGVWSVGEDPGDGSSDPVAEIKDRSAMKWLVSLPNEGEAALLESYASPSLNVVPDGAVVMNDHPDHPVILPTEELPESNGTGGSYAYWVADEGIKASAALPFASPSTGKENLGVRNPSAMELSVVQGFAGIWDESTFESLKESVAEVSALDAVPLALTVNSKTIEEREHDLTLTAKAVPVNVRDGGLKKDLGAAMKGVGDSWQDLLDYHGSDQLFDPISGVQAEMDPGGPLWEQFRSYYQSRPLGNGTVVSVESTDSQSALSPVISHFSLHHHILFYDTGGDQYRPRLCLFPVFVLWNPYNKPIAPETYYLKVTDNSLVSNHDTLTMQIQARVFLDGDDGAADTATYESGATTLGFKESPEFPHTVDSPYYFQIQTNGIPAGEALIFSAGDKVEALPVDPEEPIVLSPGYYEGYYFYKDAPATMDMSGVKAGVANITYFALYMQSANFLRVRMAKDSTSNLENEILLQYVSGQNSFVPGSGGGVQAPVKWPGKVDMLVPAGQEEDPLIAGHPAYDQSSFPASGAYMHLKMARNFAEVNNNDDLTTSQRLNMPYIRYVANANPRAPRSSKGVLEEINFGNNNGSDMAFNPTYFGNSEMYHVTRLLPANHSYLAYISGDTRVDLGFSDDPSDFSEDGWVLYEVPEDESYFLSVADLSMANLTQPLVRGDRFYKRPTINYNIQNLWPAYSIGNSLQDPRIPRDRLAQGDWPDEASAVDGFYHYDVSYLLNDALWDPYFFSGYNDDPSVGGSWNTRYEVGVNFTEGFDESAANLTILGSFNVNSTSVEAWKAFLASSQRLSVEYQGGSYEDHEEISFLRINDPVSGPTPDVRNSQTSQVYNGFLTLNEGDISNLAEAIVDQVKARGPFISLSHFVNRTLANSANQSEKESDYEGTGADGRRAMMVGALQAAIDLSEINEESSDGSARFNDPNYEMSESELNDFYEYVDVDASLGDRAAANPGYLTQLDLMDAIGAVISVRSDTFRIHAYGEAVNSVSGEVTGRARCAMTVQRVVEYVDPGNEPEDAPDDLLPMNDAFGRQFRIVDFQWKEDTI